MNERERVGENLRVIRSLLERVTLYRAISAPAAFLGGISSLGIAAWMLRRTGFLSTSDAEVALSSRDFISPWLLPLFLTASVTIFFVWREAGRDQRPFVSSGMRLALGSLLAPVLIATAVTYVAWRNPSDLDGPVIVALTWISSYGVALLATAHFAPRALAMLGWSFVITAVIWLLIISAPTLPEIDLLHGQTGANLAMGMTFGLYHLLYALVVWSSRAVPANPE